MKGQHRDEHLPLERVEIRFDTEWSAVVGFVIKVPGANPRVWGEHDERGEFEQVSNDCNPEKADGFYAFLLAVVGAVRCGMAESSEVLKDDFSAGFKAAGTFYSLGDGKIYQDRLFGFRVNNTSKVAVKGSFNATGRPGKPPGVTVFLRKRFDVKIFHDGVICNNLSNAEQALKRMYQARSRKQKDLTVGQSFRSDNLGGRSCPAGTYLPRPEIESALGIALQGGNPIILVYGEQGSGRFTVVREFLKSNFHDLPFEGVVKYEIVPGVPNPAVGVADILAEVGRVLNVPKFRAVDKPSDLHAAKAEFSRRGVLLVLRHFEPSKHPEVMDWLRSLERSKAVIICSERFQCPFCHPVEVRGLADHAEKFLNLCISVSLRPGLFCQELRREILQHMGTLPQRIWKAVTALDVTASIQRLHEPKFTSKLVEQCLSNLDTESANYLLAVSLFPHGVDMESLALILQCENEDIEKAHRSLAGFVRYEETGGFSLAEPPTGRLLQKKHPQAYSVIKERWYSHFEKVASGVGFCWEDVGKLETLDHPVIAQNLPFVLATAMEEKRYGTVMTIGRECRYWQYVRGDWLSPQSPIEMWQVAAQQANNDAELFEALVYKLNIRSKQGFASEADQLKAEADTVLARIKMPSKEALDRYEHSVALWQVAHGDLDGAAERWEKRLKDRKANPHERSAMQRHYALCLKDRDDLKGARRILVKQIEEVEGKYERSALMAHISLAELDLLKCPPDFEAAETRLKNVEERVIAVRDLAFLGDWSFCYAQCLAHNGDLPEFKAAAERARQCFSKLGKEKKMTAVCKLIAERTPQPNV